MTNNQTIKSLIIDLNHIIKYPGMFSVNRVEDFKLIITGYELALSNTEQGQEINEFIQKFRKFVNDWSENDEENDWVRLIRFRSASDSHSIELFSNLLNDFLNHQ